MKFHFPLLFFFFFYDRSIQTWIMKEITFRFIFYGDFFIRKSFFPPSFLLLFSFPLFFFFFNRRKQVVTESHGVTVVPLRKHNCCKKSFLPECRNTFTINRKLTSWRDFSLMDSLEAIIEQSRVSIRSIMIVFC